MAAWGMDYERSGSVAQRVGTYRGIGLFRSACSDMAVSGHGIDNPRIPTALGVREPQNRRVEIVFG
jgi:hypothetical protein